MAKKKTKYTKPTKEEVKEILIMCNMYEEDILKFWPKQMYDWDFLRHCLRFRAERLINIANSCLP